MHQFHYFKMICLISDAQPFMHKSYFCRSYWFCHISAWAFIDASQIYFSPIYRVKRIPLLTIHFAPSFDRGDFWLFLTAASRCFCSLYSYDGDYHFGGAILLAGREYPSYRRQKVGLVHSALSTRWHWLSTDNDFMLYTKTSRWYKAASDVVDWNIYR